MKVIIMAGGQGTRFWPWSVKSKPKQFLSLSSNKTMLQDTYERYSQWLSINKIFVVTTEEYLGLVMEQLPELSHDQIILEPCRRDTAPCTALSALHFLDKNDDEVLVMCPADHYISDTKALKESLVLAEEIATLHDQAIVTLGISPTRPETGYGYIKTENKFEKPFLQVKEFIEKPSKDFANELLDTENVFWNSGIFIWKPSTISFYMKKYESKIWNTLKENKDCIADVYCTLPKVSVDYAILEKAKNIYTIPATFIWDDLGTWSTLERIYERDSNDNVLLGDIETYSVRDCMILAQDKKVMVLGVKDLIIALTDDGLLVCHKSQEQKIKEILNSLTEDQK